MNKRFMFGFAILTLTVLSACDNSNNESSDDSISDSSYISEETVSVEFAESSASATHVDSDSGVNSIESFNDSSYISEETTSDEFIESQEITENAESEEIFTRDMLPEIPLDISAIGYINVLDSYPETTSVLYDLQDGDNVYCFYWHDIMSLASQRYDIYRYNISDGSFELMYTIKDVPSRMGQPVLTDNYICWCREYASYRKDSIIEAIPRDGGDVVLLADENTFTEALPTYYTTLTSKGDTVFWQDTRKTEHSLEIGKQICSFASGE